MSLNRMPALFIGHGNPMNALERNRYTQSWSAIGKALPRPKAIICISAHWYLPSTLVTAMPSPRTIHDFGGFPKELFAFEYPAPGDAALASRLQKLLSAEGIELDQQWGLDHGTWSVLCHIFPDAGVPVVQLSIDETQPAAFHYELGRKLAPLRDEGILVMGSGNIVHNLHAYAWGRHPVDPFDWAIRFETKVRQSLLFWNHAPLIEYETLGRDATLAAPTPDHYLPLLYVMGTARQGEAVTFPVDGVDGGSISMLSVQFG